MKKALRKVALAATLIFATNSLLGQIPTIAWSKTFYAGNNSLRSGIKTFDKGYITIGSITDTNTYDQNALIMKFDSSDNLMWSKSLGGSNYDFGVSVIQTPDSGYMALGRTTSGDGDALGNSDTTNANIWLIKLNQTGTISWQKTFGGSGLDNGEKIIPLSNQNYLLLGSTNSNDSGITGNHGGSDAFVIKITNTGNILWSKCYGGSNNDGAGDAVVNLDGSIVITGSTESYDGDIFSYPNGNEDVWVFKIDSTGILKWSKLFGGSNVEYCNNIQKTSHGYLLAGMKQHITSGSYTESDAWILCIDTLGNFQSEKKFGGTKDEGFYEITKNSHNNYVILGWTTSNDGDVSGNHDTTGLLADTWVIEIDSNLVLKSQKCFGGTGPDFLTSIIPIGNDNLICVGLTESNDGDIADTTNYQSVWLLKLSSEKKITITSPNGGEVYNPGQQMLISWNSKNISNIDTVTIVLQTFPNSVSLDEVAIIRTPNTGSFTWVIPQILQEPCESGICTVPFGNVFKICIFFDSLSFRYFDFSNDTFSIVPAILASYDLLFTASLQKDVVHLKWNSETNQTYEIQRSSDAQRWENISQTTASSFDDTHPLYGVSYYRLKVFEKDGSFSYSNIDKILYHPNTVHVFPTLVQSTCTISGIKSGEKVQVYNAVGVLLFSKISFGNSMGVDLSKYPTGMYVIVVNNFSTKVIKQ